VTKTARVNYTSLGVGLLGVGLSFFALPGHLDVTLPSGQVARISLPWFNALALSLLNGAVWSALSIVLQDYAARRREDEWLGRIEERLRRMIEHSAFCTEHDVFQRKMDLLRDTHGRVAWVLAKFISKKLNEDFRWLSVRMPAIQYGNFAAELYKECETSICLASPFSIDEWFALATDWSRDDLQRHARTLDLSKHMEQLRNAPAQTKRRLMILDAGQWAEMQARRHLNAADPRRQLAAKFLGFHVKAGVQVRFVLASVLEQHITTEARVNERPDGENVPLLDWERCILDRTLEMRWCKPTAPRGQTEVILEPLLSREVELLDDLFFHNFDDVGESFDDML
jgi:hypothetical protein